MIEKLNIPFIKNKQKLSIFELELFVELIENHLNWNQILEIMNLKNDDQYILSQINSNAVYINNICQNHLPKTYKIDWIIKRTIKRRWLIECFKKSFSYPIFLWLLSLNLMTFLVIYILPSTLETFKSISSSTNMLNILMIFVQFLIGLEWGILFIVIGLFYTTRNRKLTNLYIKMYQRNKNNLFVYLVSYLYLFDFIFLLNLDLPIDTLMSILKLIDYPMYFEISDTVQTRLKQGHSIKLSFEYLDLTFIKLLKIDDFERKINDRISQYINILKKLIEINIKKYAVFTIAIVYIQIGLMVFTVYSILLYPLKLLEGMNL